MPRPAAILGILPAQLGYISVKIDGIPPMELPPDGTNDSPKTYPLAASQTRRTNSSRHVPRWQRRFRTRPKSG
ncbi:hypothetical protein ARTHRO_11758 [Limnospira indica PCC 8005]|uniref:Uncharacterized protein n=1 Tax=Limnospira indica PCC 8005 TaxID=376219 RepID=A0A9P1KCT7_9CYAN|nr:hypothetical protein ARTHRO_11758 [Limnospira indica PCC 8005]